VTTQTCQPRRAPVGRRARGASLSLAGLALGLVLSATIAGTAAGAEPAQSAGTIAPGGAPKVAPSAKGEPAPPTRPEPKPKRNPKDPAPVDEEQDPPGPGERFTVTSALNLFASAGFRYQDPNFYACTATSVMDMLNFVAIARSGGTGFRWSVGLGSTRRDLILAWERTHDTMVGGNGSDPHGWRNALNYYGWGPTAMYGTSRSTRITPSAHTPGRSRPPFGRSSEPTSQSASRPGAEGTPR
jgi:hypothetical protein